MKKILIIIGFLILSGCQSASETEDQLPRFGQGYPFPYEGKKYVLAYARQNNNHVFKIMRQDMGFFLLNDASKREAAAVAYNIVRFNICRNGEVTLLNIIEADRILDNKKGQLTRYIANFKCQFD